MHHPIRVWTRVDRQGYTDKCSFPYASQWFLSLHGHGYVDTGALTGVAWPLDLDNSEHWAF